MKKLIAFLLLAICFLLSVSSVQARYIIENGGLSEPEQDYLDAVQDPDLNFQKYLTKTYEVGTVMLETILGGIPVIEEGTGAYHREGGVIGMVNNLITTLYSTQPASSVEYLADVGRNLGLAEPAYAQGLGWTAFSPVLDLWKKFRNIAYLFFVIIFVVIGFMIMFRAKIDPQTVISIQNALPRIVITLLLVTFSYAIAGLVIDLMELFTRIIGNTLVKGELLGLGNPTETLRDLFSSSVFKLVNPLRNVDDIVGAIRETGIGTELPGPIAWLASLTVGVIFWIAGFFIMFKIFFALLGPYITIILSIIFAPFQLLLGAIPGRNSLGGWLKQILANAAVFPVTFAMLCISAILQSGETLAKCEPGLMTLGGPGGSALWCTSTEQITHLWTPIGINLGTAVGHIAGFGVLFAIPKVADIVKEALQYKPPVAGAAAGEEIKHAVGRIPFIKSFIGG